MTDRQGVRYGKDPLSALTHFFGLLLSIAGLVALCVLSHDDGPKLAVMTTYGITLVAVFLSSTCYHFFDLGERGNRWLRSLDHSAIFLLIGGTYAPAVLHLTDGPGRLFLLGLVIALALTGIIFKVVWVECPDKLSTILYLGFGWMCLVPGYWMFPQLSPGAMAWLALGGLAYTGGAIIYVKERPDPWPEVFGHHEVWHICVLAGAAAHFMFTLGFMDQAYPPFQGPLAVAQEAQAKWTLPGQRPCRLMLRTFFKRLFMSNPDLLSVGDPAPDFECTAHTGETVHLSDFQGQRLVLWFFPKADTPG